MSKPIAVNAMNATEFLLYGCHIPLYLIPIRAVAQTAAAADAEPYTSIANIFDADSIA